jgi:prepilin-type N-terminal cleavage/methylation domain-containing protein
MASSMIGRDGNSRVGRPREHGFTLIEVMVSMAVLTVGMVSLLGVFGLAVATTQTSQQNMIAKQIANEALESIITARNTSQLSWDAIQNVGSPNCTSGAPPCGIFLSNLQPIDFPGADGIFGTTDDAAAGVEILRDPGSDGIYNTTDDTLIPLTGYQRTILFSPLYDSNNNLVPTLRSVTITIQYASGGARQPLTYVLNTYISQYQ